MIRSSTGLQLALPQRSEPTLLVARPEEAQTIFYTPPTRRHYGAAGSRWKSLGATLAIYGVVAGGCWFRSRCLSSGPRRLRR